MLVQGVDLRHEREPPLRLALVALLQGTGDPLERRGQPVEHGAEPFAHEPYRIDGEEHGAHRERRAAADERVEGAAELEALGWLQRGHEHRGCACLGGEQRPAAHERCGQHRETGHNADLPGAGADGRHEQVCDRDPHRDPDGELDCAPAALPDGEAERDHGGDRREEWLLMPDKLGGK